MKMEIWPDDVGMPEMTDWLAELRDDGHAEAAEDGPEGRAGADEASPEVSVPAQADGSVSSDQASAPAKTSSPGQISLPDETGATGQMSLPDETGATGQISLPADTGPIGEISLPAETGAMDRPWPPAETGATVPTWPTTDTSPTGRIRVPAEDSPTGRVRFPAEASPRSRTRHSARPSAAAEITERAVIGDQLRMPIVWCEMGSCISWHADHAALGEADIRARAIGAGWRVDALGRLACPRCQQTASGFRVSRPVVLWDRRAAITRAARMAGLRGNGAAGERGRDPRPPASHRLPASPPGARGVAQAGRTATAVQPAHPADSSDCRWLMLAAETAGLTRDSGQPAPDACLTGRGDQPRIVTCTPGTDAGSVHAARDFTLATLRRWEAAERGEDIAIVVTELLTNALRHALPWPGDPPPRRPIRLGLLQPGSCVLCAVADPSRAVPVPQGRGSLAETGRGLQIIRALSDMWGYTVLSDVGKVVWAAFTCADRRRPGLAWAGGRGAADLDRGNDRRGQDHHGPADSDLADEPGRRRTGLR